ncbi:hypothetical protein M1555_02965 [Patescibacteria group bacterium]|nr:hypothetical protein [Patescibacteria group bacterium]
MRVRPARLGLILILFPLTVLAAAVFLTKIRASSQQAYQDYLYQFDVYRQKDSEFQVARNEYLKFQTLTSQNTAITKTTAMLSQRDLLLRSYLLLLKEKVNEVPEMSGADQNLYLTLINNEVSFLESHSQLVTSIGSLDDAVNVEGQLTGHYGILEASMRQTLVGIATGTLANLAKRYDIALADASAVVNSNRGVFTPEKQAMIDRWILQITNTRSLYQQKMDAIAADTNKMSHTDVLIEQDSQFSQIQQEISEARQYLVEGTSYLSELTKALRYQN